MRWATTLGTALVAEAAAHFLSLTWGFAVLVLAFVLVAVRVSVTMAAATAKTASTETRLNAHVAATAPAVNLVANGGTIGGTVVVAGDHHINGTLYGAGGALTVGDQINGGAASFSGATTDFGHTTHGSLGVDNNITASGNLSANNFGGSYAGGQSVSGLPFGAGTVIGSNSGGNVSMSSGFQGALNSIYNAINNAHVIN